MLTTSLLSLALAAFVAAAPAPQTTQSADVVVDLYSDPYCPGSNPLAQPPPQDFQDGLCHSLYGTFKSGQFALTFEGADQSLQFFEDAACTNKTLELTNDGSATGQCFTDSGDGWQGFIYLTYR